MRGVVVMSLTINDPRTLSAPGLSTGDYVALSNEDFLRGFAHVMGVLMEKITVDQFEEIAAVQARSSLLRQA